MYQFSKSITLMKKTLFLLFISISLTACSDKEIQLPDASFESSSTIEDVSSAFVFYDEATGNAEMNKNNLISTTNWIINIDKRLSLADVMPYVQELQAKRDKKSIHKNEAARTYLGGYDTNEQQPVFIDISDNRYNDGSALANFTNAGRSLDFSDKIFLSFDVNKVTILNDDEMTTTTFGDFHKILFKLLQKSRIPKKVFTSYHQDLSYQDFYKLKSTLANVQFINGSLAQNEFIYK